MNILGQYHLLEMVRREMGGDYAPQQLSILLLASTDEGITYPDLAAHLSMPQPTVSRNCRKLEVGYGFIRVVDNFEIGYRRKAVYLTDKGKAFIKRIKTMLQD